MTTSTAHRRAITELVRGARALEPLGPCILVSGAMVPLLYRATGTFAPTELPVLATSEIDWLVTRPLPASLSMRRALEMADFVIFPVPTVDGRGVVHTFQLRVVVAPGCCTRYVARMRRLLVLCVLAGCSSGSFELGGVIDDAAVDDSTSADTTADDARGDLAEAPDPDASPDGSPLDVGLVDSMRIDAALDAPDALDTLDTLTLDTLTLDTLADVSDGAPGPCSPTDLPPALAVFVSPLASGGGNGSAAAPLTTIADAMVLARVEHRARVILDTGTYTEAVRFVDSDPGIVVQGGWKRGSGGWTRLCDVNARDLTTISAPSGIAVTAEGVTRLSGLRQLTVRTKTSVAAGESTFGVFVRGAGSRFFLDDVVVVASNAGSGGTGAGVGVVTTQCNGATDCSTGLAGPLGPNAAPAAAGTFTVDGFTTGDGKPGTPGASGANGQAGSVSTLYCVTSCYENTCNPTPTCKKDVQASSSSGTCGCGGAGGGAGGGGLGGGASVALYVKGVDAKVAVTRSDLRAGNGGKGGDPGDGASGASGSAGRDGQSISCPVACTAYAGSPCTQTQYHCTMAGAASAGGGTAGGTGGTGGPGGRGGGGAGGPSYVIVEPAAGAALVDGATTLTAGTGGAGTFAAPAGGAGLRFIAP